MNNNGIFILGYVSATSPTRRTKMSAISISSALHEKQWRAFLMRMILHQELIGWCFLPNSTWCIAFSIERDITKCCSFCEVKSSTEASALFNNCTLIKSNKKLLHTRSFLLLLFGSSEWTMCCNPVTNIFWGCLHEMWAKFICSYAPAVGAKFRRGSRSQKESWKLNSDERCQLTELLSAWFDQCPQMESPPLSLKGLCWKFKDSVVYRTQMCVYVAGISRIHWRWFTSFASYLYSNQSIEGATVACSLLDSGERRTRSSTCPVHRPQNVSLYEPHVQHKCCFLSNSRLPLTAPSLQ